MRYEQDSFIGDANMVPMRDGQDHFIDDANAVTMKETTEGQEEYEREVGGLCCGGAVGFAGCVAGSVAVRALVEKETFLQRRTRRQARLLETPGLKMKSWITCWQGCKAELRTGVT